MNKHREIIYGKRNKILNSENIDTDVKEMISSQIDKFVSALVMKNVSKEDIIKKVNEFVGIELINDVVEIDDVS